MLRLFLAPVQRFSKETKRFRTLKMNFTESVSEDRSWRGVPLTELYGSHSPWGVPEFPLVSPGYNHAVLYHIDNNGTGLLERPPKPQVGHDKWDHDFVRMPCSRQSLYPVETEGSTTLKKRWEIIEETLQTPIDNSEQLANAILSYNTKFKTIWKFRALHTLFNEHLEDDESQYFFSVTLPAIAKLALALPKLIQSPIPLLKQHKNRSISLSQQQISCLLANAFFCTFPRRNTTKRASEYAAYPYINFNMLYECPGTDSVLEKLKCLCHYFRKVTSKVPAGVMTFTRRSVAPPHLPKWSESTKCIASTPLHVNSSGTIEDDGVGLIQVDFANKYLGGGVLGRGCVQEEIRFVICPELLVSMLFTEVLKPNEALLMIGCERYSKYRGYGHAFCWSGDYQDSTPFDSSGRRRCAVLAIDALPFSTKTAEYRIEFINREINKAWVGMSVHTSPEEVGMQRPGVATGNWGCGAFGGTPRLKCLLQLMAACQANRPMAYYTFGDVDLRNSLVNMYNLLDKYNVSVGQLYKYIKKFAQSDVPKSQLYEYIHQTLIDEQKSKDADIMDVSASSVTSDKVEVPAPQTKPNNSPDLFSQESEESPVAITPNLTKQRVETIVQNDKSDIHLHIKETPDVSPLASPSVRPSIKDGGLQNGGSNQTSRLLEEMDKFDKECGKLQFTDTHFSLNVSRQEKLSETSATMDEALNTSNVPEDVKMKISKKITDYFTKKS